MAYREQDHPREQKTGRWRNADETDPNGTGDLTAGHGEKLSFDPKDLCATEGKYRDDPPLDLSTVEGFTEYEAIRGRAIERTGRVLGVFLGTSTGAITAESLVDKRIREAQLQSMRNSTVSFSARHLTNVLKNPRVENWMKERGEINVSYLRVGRIYLDRLQRYGGEHGAGSLTCEVKDRLWDEAAVELFEEKRAEAETRLRRERAAQGRPLPDGPINLRHYGRYPRVEVALSNGMSSDERARYSKRDRERRHPRTTRNVPVWRHDEITGELVRNEKGRPVMERREHRTVNGRREYDQAMLRISGVREETIERMIETGRI